MDSTEKRRKRLVWRLRAALEEMAVARVGLVWKRVGEQEAVVRGTRLLFCARNCRQRRWRFRPRRA